jgi:hypothetical protein
VNPSGKPVVNCKTHGTQPQTFVCQHIVAGLIAKERVGFWWTQHDPDNPRPDAWCRECEGRVSKTGGEWEGEALEQLRPQILCGACYDSAKKFHLGGNPWS